MRKKFCRSIIRALCTIIAVLLAVAGSAFTASAESESGSLTLICRTEDVILSGLHWNIYHVGSRVGPDFVLEGDFKDYQVDLTDFSVEGMTAAAKTLENYAKVDGLAPLYSGDTGEDGLITFAPLSPGLYLLCGDTLVIDNTTYIPTTLLLEIDNSGQSVDLDAYPKIIFRADSNDISRYAVKKIWKDENGQPLENPPSVTVEIYCDNKVTETITLNEDNDWTHSWDGETKAEWRVKEVDIPANCTVVYDSNETQFAIVNTVQSSNEVPTEPSTPESTEPTEEETTGDTTEATIPPTTEVPPTTEAPPPPSTTTTAEQEKLPQTGQLWWPVPVLGFMGIIFIAVGLRISSEEK